MNIDSEEEVVVSKNIRIRERHYTHEFNVYEDRDITSGWNSVQEYKYAN